jgi:hypothetical protein
VATGKPKPATATKVGRDRTGEDGAGTVQPVNADVWARKCANGAAGVCIIGLFDGEDPARVDLLMEVGVMVMVMMMMMMRMMKRREMCLMMTCARTAGRACALLVFFDGEDPTRVDLLMEVGGG